MLGAAWPVLFGEGSPMGKYLRHQQLVESVDDAGVESAMEAQLYGESTTESDTTSQTPVASLEHLEFLDQSLAVLCLLFAASLPFLCRWHHRFAWGYLVPAIWLLINAHATAVNGGKGFAELSIPAHATRWILPIVLALLVMRWPGSGPTANGLLRVACAMTFAVHGWEAFNLNPPFQDLLFITASMIGIELSSTACHGLLHAIACMDVFLALSVLLIHNHKTLWWMAVWGLITAASRPITMGWDAWPELAIRLANSACPWLILSLGLPTLFRRHNPTSSKHSATQQSS